MYDCMLSSILNGLSLSPIEGGWGNMFPLFVLQMLIFKQNKMWLH